MKKPDVGFVGSESGSVSTSLLAAMFLTMASLALWSNPETCDCNYMGEWSATGWIDVKCFATNCTQCEPVRIGFSNLFECNCQSQADPCQCYPIVEVDASGTIVGVECSVEHCNEDEEDEKDCNQAQFNFDNEVEIGRRYAICVCFI
ncbi:MAG: hypothetical protein IPK26_07205 [Planctomycetes bacterium]|nr:hypothetical protein [Planctomycetota bacterium]